MYSKVYGEGGVLLVGDTHYSDVFTGKHKNYLENSCWVLARIREKVEELKPAALVILGDIVGVYDRNVRNREVLSLLCKFFKDVSKICKVYCIRGNHDFGDYPDYQFLADLGMFETAVSTGGYFDYFAHEGDTDAEVRFHLMDYGTEGKELDLAPQGVSNVVLAHNNFTIQGVTTWYSDKDGIELGLMSNMTGVDMVVSGHIHNPSPEIVATNMVGGGTCALFYTGSPARPVKERGLYESCWFVQFKYDNASKSTMYDALAFPLRPLNEVFYDNEELIEEKTDEELEELKRTAELKEVLDDILKCRMTSGDLLGQVNSIPNASEGAKRVACNYLQMALDGKAQGK